MAVARPIPQPQHELDLSGDYRLMVEGALPAMGWDSPEAAGVPALEQIEAGLKTSPLASWLIERADRGIADTLVVAPKVGGPDGIGVANTINRLDPKAFKDGYVWGPLWGNAGGQDNPYQDKGAIHDNAGNRGLRGMWDVAVLLGDVTDPATGREAYAPGLVYTGKTVPDQRRASTAEQKELWSKQGISIVTATVGHMAVDSASLKVQGETQRAGVTRFIHYPEQKVGQYSYVPDVDDNGGRLRFSASRVGVGWSVGGVRRVVRVPIAPLEA